MLQLFDLASGELFKYLGIIEFFSPPFPLSSAQMSQQLREGKARLVIKTA